MLKRSKYLAFRILFPIFFLAACTGRMEVGRVDGQLLLIDSIRAPEIDPLIDSIAEIYRAPLIDDMNMVLAYSAQAMRKGTPEDLLNNFVADLVLGQGRRHYQPADQVQIDLCVLNYGGLRTSLPEGPVTKSRVFELMPFENEMVVLTLTPENTWQLIRYIASRSTGTPVSGVRIGIRNRQPQSVSIGGMPFDHDRSYKVLTSDYLASAGDHMQFFLEPENYEIVGMRIRDAIIRHLEEQNQAGKMISSQLDGRIYYAE